MIEKTVLVWDYGTFVELASRLTREFKRVLYLCHADKGFPESNDDQVGRGIEQVERVRSIWPHLKDIDLFVFPDTYQGPLQQYLREDCGKLVWGAGMTETLELDRWGFLQWMKGNGLAVPESYRKVGITALREFLEHEKDLWVKVSRWRGDEGGETWHFHNMTISESRIDEIEQYLGGRKELQEFILQRPVPGVEIGSDIACIDGKFPEIGSFGYEVKDVGFVGKIDRYENFPKVLLRTNEKLLPLLASYDMRGPFSTEVRTEKEDYIIDMCMRMAYPPTEALMEAYDNLGEYMLAGAQGEMVKLKANCKYFAIVRLESAPAAHTWSALEIPKDIRRWIKLHDLTIIKKREYVVPNRIPWEKVGSAIGLGNTVDEAIKLAKERAKMVRGQDLTTTEDKMDDALKIIAEGKKLGINF